MIILYWMSPDPIVIDRQGNLLDVVRLMRQHGVRRLPVVTDDDVLCGIIGRSDVNRHTGRRILTETPDPERDAPLAEIPVADVMTPEPLTCDANDYVEDVCQRMINEKVGAYPVTKRGHLVGFLSETDLLRALSELSFSHEGGRRVTIRLAIEAETELLHHAVDIARRLKLQIRSILTHRILDESASMMTLRVGGERTDKFLETLWERGYKVVDS
ncbi:MAG: CBS domain-containing protein [Planctomycetota bacterium]